MAEATVQPIAETRQTNGATSQATSEKKLKLTRNQQKRLRKKEKKAEPQSSRETSTVADGAASVEESALSNRTDGGSHSQAETHPKSDPLPDEASDTPILDESDPNYAAFKKILDRFRPADLENDAAVQAKGEVFYSDDDEIPEEEDAEGQDHEAKLSKKKRKAQTRLSVAELKEIVTRPELVEWTDTSAPDPRLLVHLKAYRNVVPVPAHWSLKREYLSSKRGIEKPAFALPKFIQDTGIAEMRDAVLEKQNEASLKQRQRERVQPKMGKLDIDYQKLYDAFFRHQTKPELTRFGEVYYEGKEYETNLRHLRPGELSVELKEALNIPPGAPPPWLINQQRFGPPPSYPAMKIPGLNAPPPPGAQWGFHPGGYGKPPVDEHNRPLYGGDIFGVMQAQVQPQAGAPVERTLWGELQEPEEEEEEDEEDSEEEEEGDEETAAALAAGTQTVGGLTTPGGMASTIPSEYGGEISVAGEMDLRKKRGTETEESSAPRSLYHILPEQQVRTSGYFGSDRQYDVKVAQQELPLLDGGDQTRKRKQPGDVDVSVDPDALPAGAKLSKEELEKKYQEQKPKEGGDWSFQEDLSDMIATESRKRLKKDEDKRGGTTSSSTGKNSGRDRRFRF